MSSGMVSSFCGRVTTYLPQFMAVVGACGGASSTVPEKKLLVNCECREPPYVKMLWGCVPQIPVRSRHGCPILNAEQMSLPPGAWDGALTSVCYGMLDRMVAVRPGAHADVQVHHPLPPCGYGLMSVAGADMSTHPPRTDGDTLLSSLGLHLPSSFIQRLLWTRVLRPWTTGASKSLPLWRSAT